MNRPWLLLLSVMCTSCVVGRDQSVAAKSDDDSVRLQRISEKVAGCGGGGHFVIVPTVDQITKYAIDIPEGPRAGAYKVRTSCGCSEGVGTLQSADDRWLMQWQCEGATDWVMAVPMDVDHTLCFRSATRLDITKPLSTYVLQLQGDSSDGALLSQIFEREGQAGLTHALASSLAMPRRPWSQAYSSLDNQHKATLHASIRTAVAREDAAMDVLMKAEFLPSEDRELMLAVAMRLAARPMDHIGPTFFAPEGLFERLAVDRVDDLGPLNCRVGRECNPTCQRVLAASDFPCPRYRPPTQNEQGVP